MLTVRMMIALIMMFALCATAAATPPAGDQPDQIDQLAEMLGLSDDQQSDIRELVDDMSPRIEAKQAEVQQLQQDLQGRAGAGADEDSIREDAARLGELTGEMTALSLIMQSRVEGVFTAEQREQLEAEAQRQQEQQQMQQQQMQQQMQEQMQQQQ